MIHMNSDNLGFGMPARHTQKTIASELTLSYRFKLGLFALLGHAVVHGPLLGLVLITAIIWADYAVSAVLNNVVLITLILILLLLLSVSRIRLENLRVIRCNRMILQSYSPC